MTNFNPELLHLYPAIYLSFHYFSEPTGHFRARTLVINSLDRLTKIASFLLYSPKIFSNTLMLDSRRIQSVSLFETPQPQILLQYHAYPMIQMHACTATVIFGWR